MDGRNLRERVVLTVDLLTVLLDRDAVCPDSVTVTRVQSWFSARERDLAADVVAELATRPDAPVEYVTSQRASVWLTDREKARAYVGRLRDDPPWFDP